jgi:phosphatidylglycerol:prolipoprotein diacylglycerol transferase
MVAFTLPGGLPVYIFPLLLAVSVVTGLVWSASGVKDKEMPGLVDAGISAVVGGVLVGRAAYVAVHWLYFRERWTEVFQLQLGGLSWVGAVLGSVMALWIFARLRHQPWTLLLDQLLPLVTTVAIGVWLACWVDGVAYGQAITAWWAFPAPDEWGALAPRLPVQFLGAAFTLGLYWLVDQPLLRKANPTQPVVFWMAGFFSIVLALSFLRADPAPVWAGLRLDVWGGLLLSIASILFLWIFTLTQRRVMDKG